MRTDELLESCDLARDAVDRAKRNEIADIREAIEVNQVLGRARAIVGQRVGAIESPVVQVEPATRSKHDCMAVC